MSAEARATAYEAGVAAVATDESNPYPEGSESWFCWNLGRAIEIEEMEDEDDAYCERCGAEDESCTVVWKIESTRHAHKVLCWPCWDFLVDSGEITPTP